MISRTKTSIMEQFCWWLLFDFLAIVSVNCGVTAAECQQTFMDLAFIVDASGSIGTEHFQEQLDFLETFISKMPIDEGYVRIGIVVFGTKARVEFTLSKFNETKKILDAISAITYDGTKTNVAAALRLARTDVFTPEGGDRDNVTNVAILVADGKPNLETSKTASEAKELKNIGVRVIVLAITSNPEVFDNISSRPTELNVISINSFSVLDSVHSNVYSLLCNECQQTSMDLAFIVDASDITETYHIQEQLRFLQTFISTMSIDEGYVRIGIVVSGTDARVEVTLNQFNSRKEILDEISAITYHGTKTNVAAALRLARTDVFTPEGGDRDNVTNVAILVADGKPNLETSNTTREANKLKNSGVRIIAVAITPNPEVFDTIASISTSGDTISIDSFSELDEVHSNLSSLLCTGVGKSQRSDKKSTKNRTSQPQPKSKTTISAKPNSETETTASKTATNTMKSTEMHATPPTSKSQSQSERTTISAKPNSETETTASKRPTNTMKSTKMQATPPTSNSKSKSERTTISTKPNSETETTASKTATNTMKFTKMQATPPTSQSQSERTIMSTRPTSRTETTASKTPTNTLVTTSTPITPISTTAVTITSTLTQMTSKTTPDVTTTTSTTLTATNPATTVNAGDSSNTHTGLLNVSGITRSSINAALQRCYKRCENPGGATPVLVRTINSLRLQKKGLSKQRREKTTASDDRQSSAVVASVVLAIVLTPILCLVIWDLINLCRYRCDPIHKRNVSANNL